MKQLPPWLPVIPESYHKSDDLYEAEQHAMISYFETCEYFLERLRQEIKRTQHARKIWDDTHPVRVVYKQACRDHAQLRRQVLYLLQDMPRYKEFVCPVTMPIITGYIGEMS
jgi:hypothetical protein